jgi:hypothetical protein
MKRVNALKLEDLQTSEIPFARVKIRGEVTDLDDNTLLAPETQRALINVRTDFDRFSIEEITTLVAHGYSKAREELIEKKLATSDAPKFSWDPLQNWTALNTPRASRELRDSKQRKWRIWSSRDWVS